MRKTYRYRQTKEYWRERWLQTGADDPMVAEHSYPLKFAIETIKDDKDGPILEAGCGPGRILKYFHNRGYSIKGIDYIDVVIEKLKASDLSIECNTGDVADLKFDDCSFKYVLAYGLYHNLEYDFDVALNETFRVIKSRGVLNASFRADNLQTRISDWWIDISLKKKNHGRKKFFHKVNFTRRELISRVEGAGFFIESIVPVENMPFLYRFSVFRDENQKAFSESNARVDGYRLTRFGALVQNFLMKIAPNLFCNLYVVTARKL